MFMRSDRLFLRPAWIDDGREIERIVQCGVMSNVPAERLPRTMKAVGEWLTGSERPLVSLLITLPSVSGSEVIGGIGLMREIGDAPGEARLGYWLSQDHWGYGYAAEAARAVLTLAGTLGLTRIYAAQSVDDRASLLVLTRAGFRPTGEQRLYGENMAAIYVAGIVGSAGDDRTDEVRAA